MKILIALDDSPQSQCALDFASRMRWPAGSRMIVLSVLPPMPAGIADAYVASPAVVRPVDETPSRLQDVVSRAERTLRETGFSTEGRVAEGDPREALVDMARAERADLIVLGSHGRTGIAKLMLGSVSSHVVTHAPCSVLVVKETGRRGAVPEPREEDTP